MKTVQIIIASSDDTPWRTIMVDGAPPRTPSCVLVAPGSHVLAKTIEVAGSTPAQSRAAALAHLSTELAQPAAGLTCVLAPGPGRRLALVASASWIASLRDVATQRGFRPGIVVPDYLFLPVAHDDTAHVAMLSDNDVAARTSDAAFTCQRDLVERLLHGRTMIEIDYDDAVRATVQSGAIVSQPSLYAPVAPQRTHARRSFAAPALAACAALVAAAVAPWVSQARMSDATAKLRHEGLQIARAALPDASRIVDAEAQLREYALPDQRALQALNGATAILEGVGLSAGVQLSSLAVRADGASQAVLAAAEVSQLQPLRDHLASLGLSLTETPGDSTVNHLSITVEVAGAR